MPYPRLEVRPLAELLAHPDSLREASVEAAYNVGKSVEFFGLLRPLVVNARTGHLIDGDIVLKKLREIGVKEAPVWCVDVAEDMEDVAHLALNNHASEWDWQKVSKLFAQLNKITTTLALTGFHPYDILPLTAAEWQPNPVGNGADLAQQSLF